MIGVNIKAPNDEGWGAQVFSAESGQEINGIERLSITFAPDDYPRVDATLCAAAVEVEGALAEFYVTDPSSGQSKPVKRIEFADGTAWELGEVAPHVGESGVMTLRSINAPAQKVRRRS
jgi:hypothetical protein